MPTLRLDAVLRSALWGLLILLSLSACSPTYHFRYQYALIAPPGGTEGVENDQVHIQLSPTSESGIMQLAVVNKSPQAMAIVWDQTHYIDPFGRRRAASETGLQWFFRLREWFAEDTPIDPGDTFHTRVQAGERQEYAIPLRSPALPAGTSPSLLPPRRSCRLAARRAPWGRRTRGASPISSSPSVLALT